MYRRTLLRAVAATVPVALAGCGGSQSGDEKTPGEGGTPTATADFAEFEPGALNVTYSRLDATSYGEAVAQVTVVNAANESRSGALTIHFSTENGTGTAIEVVEVPAGARKRVRIPLSAPVEGLTLQNFTFDPPT